MCFDLRRTNLNEVIMFSQSIRHSDSNKVDRHISAFRLLRMNFMRIFAIKVLENYIIDRK